MPTSTSGECPAGQVRDFDGICFTPSTTSPSPTGGQPAITSPSGGQPAVTNPSENIYLLNPLKGGESLESFLLNILDFVIRIGAIVVVFMIVWVGYLFVAARGNETKIIAARQALLWTIVGALILLGAKAIALGIEATVKALSVGS